MQAARVGRNNRRALRRISGCQRETPVRGIYKVIDVGLISPTYRAARPVTFLHGEARAPDAIDGLPIGG
jgi:hypothetical protein